MRLLLLALLTLPCTSVRAQNADPTALETALHRAFDKGNLLVALSPVQWRTGLTLAATRLDAGQTSTVEVYLRRRHNYAFLATAASEATDVDLYLRDSLGNILATDREDDGTPILEFRVPRTGNYRLQVHVAAANETVNHVALALLSGAGRVVIEDNYRRQADQFFTATRQLLASAEQPGKLHARGQWPVRAYLLPAGRGITSSVATPPHGDLVLAAIAPSAAKFLSLYIGDAAGNVITSSQDGSPYPLVTLSGRPGERFDLRLESISHRAPTLVFLGAFQE